MNYRVVFTDEAERRLATIKDKRELEILLSRIDRLAENPELQGKPLNSHLAGYRSIQAVG